MMDFRFLLGESKARRTEKAFGERAVVGIFMIDAIRTTGYSMWGTKNWEMVVKIVQHPPLSAPRLFLGLNWKANAGWLLGALNGALCGILDA
jgi:hypothetical protein